jgi:hypothetical protein
VSLCLKFVAESVYCIKWRVTVSKLRSYKNRDTLYTTLLTFPWTAQWHLAPLCPHSTVPPHIPIIIAPMVAAAVDTYTQTIMSTHHVNHSVCLYIYFRPVLDWRWIELVFVHQFRNSWKGIAASLPVGTIRTPVDLANMLSSPMQPSTE